jgi:L-methionine (R)-S-oxide reductase
MAETIFIPDTKDKKNLYEALLPQLIGLCEGEEDLIANLANLCAGLKEAFGFFWVGFYLVKNNQLVLGPFQGPIACTRIAYGKGVCGSSWKEGKTLVVPDVDAFPGHIACSSLSRSEIVVPVRNHKGEIKMVLDIDSSELNSFDELDQHYLELLFEKLSLSFE